MSNSVYQTGDIRTKVYGKLVDITGTEHEGAFTVENIGIIGMHVQSSAGWIFPMSSVVCLRDEIGERDE